MKAGRPRVLVYGAGVWGCLLRHALLQGGNAVALLCRGAWKRVVDERGLVIRHWGRLRATAESVPTVASLAPRDKYDVIFVAVRFTQIANVLEALAKNCSRHVVFVGNNPAAGATLSALRALSNAPREVAFGFQSSGGRREKESVARHIRPPGHDGGRGAWGDARGNARAAGTAVCRSALSLAFSARYGRVSQVPCGPHFAGACSVYRCGGDLRRCRKDDRRTVIRATLEGYAVLRARGTPILPPEDEKF